MRITDILRGIEKLVLEILLWLIFIPKTYFAIIARPYWIREYVDAELQQADAGKHSDGFEDYMSPVMLFLVSSVLLFIITNQISVGDDTTATKIISELRGTTGMVAGLGFLAMPVIFALLSELLRKRPLTRAGVRRIVFIQCYYFTPPILSVFAVDLLLKVTPDDAAATVVGATGVMAGMMLWFVIAETRLMSQELQTGLFKGFGAFAFAIVILLFGAVFVAAWATGPAVDDTIGGPEIADGVVLPARGAYDIIVTDFNGNVGGYGLTLSGPASAVTNPATAAAARQAEASLSYGASIAGITSSEAPHWRFYGNAGDTVSIVVEPLDDLDLVLDVRDSSGESILTVDRSGLFWLIGFVYVVVFGWALLRGLRSLFKSDGGNETQPAA